MKSLNERHEQSLPPLSALPSDEYQRDYYAQSYKQGQSSNVTNVSSSTTSACVGKNQHPTYHNRYYQHGLRSRCHNCRHHPHNGLLYCHDKCLSVSNSRAFVCFASTASVLALSSSPPPPPTTSKNVASRTMITRSKNDTDNNDRHQSSAGKRSLTKIREGGSRTRRRATPSSPLSSPFKNLLANIISLAVFSVVIVHIYQLATIATALAQPATIAGAGNGSDNSSSSSSSRGVDYELKQQIVNASTGNSQASRLILSRSLQVSNEDDEQAPASGNTLRALVPESMRNLNGDNSNKPPAINISNAFEYIVKKRPYSKYWTAEQKWDDLFKRLLAVQGTVRQMLMKSFMRDIEYYADLSISAQCEKDLKYVQSYAKQSTNFRWLAHMFDATGKSEPGMLTGMLSELGHPVQCIKVRAPAKPTNVTFDERYFEQQTEALGERFRGKYCLASVRPVLPKKPHLISRFSSLMNESLLSNVSYAGESSQLLKLRARQISVPASDRRHHSIDGQHLIRLDQIPFESELYNLLIKQRNFMFTLPQFKGYCYPSSCTRDDIKSSLQRIFDDQHQVVDIEFECEQEEVSAWDWFITPRVIAYVLLALIASLIFLASFARYVLLSKLRIRRAKLAPTSRLATLLDALDMFSMDKCAGILFVKTKRASPLVDWSRVENNRSTTIDALKGFLMLLLIYSQLTVLGCLPVPFMWSKWSDAMFPFFRSAATQPFINMSIWTEAFYMISAYLIALKLFENHRPKIEPQMGITNSSSKPLDNGANTGSGAKSRLLPNLSSFIIKRYVRLVVPMIAFILLNYIWPRLSNGFVFQDQSNKLMKPCDTYGWTNMLLYHNNYNLNETCLWPSHVSATFFQLHVLSYPLLALCLMALYAQFNNNFDNNKTCKLTKSDNMRASLLTWLTFAIMGALAVLASVYSALQASQQELIVPFLIDYIDFDNYRRVLEWTVLPAYNHTTSYIFGMALAFVVIRRKAQNELQKLDSKHWFSGGGAELDNNDCQSSPGSQSAQSSSTQELQDGLTFKSSLSHGANKYHITSRPSSTCASSQRGEYDDDDDDFDTDASLTRRNSSGILWRLATNSLSCIILIACLMASWFWNGLGQPMSSEQTFWYVLITKLGFCLAFAHLFLEHFATRRNSNNPWMITRFLVPIGRMSLSLFYVSWLVTWFDLLASLYQWHPSHYFVFEKYNEIGFLALVLGMFVYGAFEGVIKRIQYATRLGRVEYDAKLSLQLQQQQQHQLQTISSHQRTPVGVCLSFDADKLEDCGVGKASKRFRVKPFESFFHPTDKLSTDDEPETKAHDKLSQAHQSQMEVTGDKLQAQIHVESLVAESLSTPSHGKLSNVSYGDGGGAGLNQMDQQRPHKSYKTGADSRQSGAGQQASASDCNLSPSDRYLLNAELRANSSFASIGLYENAGATADLSALNSNDPQESPAISPKL